MAKKEKVQQMAVALTGKGTSDVIALLEEKIKSLKHIEETVYKTSGNLEGGFPDIKGEMKKENLVKALSSIIGRETHYNKAAQILGGSFPVFTVSGSNAADWEHDIRLRLAIIDHKETLDTLNKFKSQISSFLSAAEQKEMVMGELAAFLAKA